MKNSQHKWILGFILAFSMGAAFAQDPNPPSPAPSGGWRRFQPSASPDGAPSAEYQAQESRRFAEAPPLGPTRITIPAGTWITVRVNEPLSSDHNQPGDAFMATIAQPLVVNGLVVARRGQTVSGMVSEAKKAGRASGTSRLGLELTEIGLADGSQVQVKTSLMERHGETSYGRDAVGIGATVATGAAIGAAVNGGVGAGVGAAAGVVASTIGVLLTRGRATEVYPETPMTFRLVNAVTVEGTYEAFHPASQQDFDQRPPQTPPRRAYGPYGPYGPPPPYLYRYPRYYSPYPYFYGPSFSFFYSNRGYRHRW